MRLLLFGLILLIAQNSFSQQAGLFVKDHINLTFTNTWINSQETDPFGAGASLGLRPDWGGKLGLVYTINLGQRIGLETGTYFGIQTIGYRVKVESPRDYSMNDFRFRDAHAYVEIPLRVFGRFKVKSRLYSFSYLGANATRFRQVESGASTSDSLGRQGLSFSYQTNPEQGMHLSWNLGTGFLWQMENEDMLRINLVYHPNTNPTGLAVGEYAFRDYDTGNVFKAARWIWQGGYIGIEFGYVFTRTRELQRNLDHIRIE